MLGDAGGCLQPQTETRLHFIQRPACLKEQVNPGFCEAMEWKYKPDLQCLVRAARGIAHTAQGLGDFVLYFLLFDFSEQK